MAKLMKELVHHYKADNFEKCCELLHTFPNLDENRTALLIKGFSSLKLNDLDAALDVYNKLEKFNHEISWTFVFEFARNFPEKYYRLIAKSCMFLLDHYEKNTDNFLDCVREFVRCVLCYDLPAPYHFDRLRDLCNMLLKHNPNDAYALEVIIRLDIEAILYALVPVIFDEAISSPDDLDKCATILPELTQSLFNNHLDQLEKQLTQANASIHQHLTRTVYTTVKIAKLLQRICAHYMRAPVVHNSDTYEQQLEEFNYSPDYTQLWHHIHDEVDVIDNFGCLGFSKWTKMDFQAGFLYALANMKLYKFDRCDSCVESLIGYCAYESGVLQSEIEELYDPKSPSQSISDSIESYPKVIRLSYLFKPNSLHWMTQWLALLRLINASNSELPPLMQKVNDFITQLDNSSLVWPSAYQSLALELYATANKQAITLPTYLSQIEITRPIDLKKESPRFCICLLQLQLNQMRTNSNYANALHSIRTSLYNLINLSKSIRSGRIHYLIGDFIDQLNELSEGVVGDGATSTEVMNVKSLEHYQYGVQSDKYYYKNFVQLAILYRSSQNYSDSLNYFARAFNLMPDSNACVYDYALELSRSNEWEKALDVYAQIDQKNFTKEMWLNYGLIALLLGRTYESLPAIQNTLVMAPSEPLYWSILGQIYLSRQSYGNAIRAFKRALSLDPNLPFTNVLCARAFRLMHDHFSAIKFLQSALSCLAGMNVTDGLNRKLTILTLKELIETYILEYDSSIKQGLTSSALTQLENILISSDDLLNMYIGAQFVPFWLFRYIGVLLSHVSTNCDLNVLINIPKRLFGLMNCKDTSTVQMDESANFVKLNIVNCLQLATVYLGCALRVCVKFTNSSLSDSDAPLKQYDPIHPLPPNSLSIVAVLIDIGTHHLRLCYLVKSNKSYAESSASTLQDLIQTTELSFKQATQLLATLTTLYDKLLADKQLLNPDSVSNDEKGSELNIREQLHLIAKMRSIAWSGLASAFSLHQDNVDKEINYCLCHSIMANPENSLALVNLALQQLKAGEIEFASKLIEQAQICSPECDNVWFTSAQLKAITYGVSVVGPSKPQSNYIVLNDLLQAARTGSSFRIISQTLLHLMPFLSQTVECIFSAPTDSYDPHHIFNNSIFLRSALNILLLAVNRGLAFQPGRLHFWHTRGIILQLLGLSLPAKDCFKKCMELAERERHDFPNEKLAYLIDAHYFLSSYLCGQPDLDMKKKLLSCTECSSLAQACAHMLCVNYSHQSSPVTDAQLLSSFDHFHRALNTLQTANDWTVKLAFMHQPHIDSWCAYIIQLMYHPRTMGRLRPKLEPFLNSIELNEIGFQLAHDLHLVITNAIDCDVELSTEENSAVIVKVLLQLSTKKLGQFEILLNSYENLFGDYFIHLNGHITYDQAMEWIVRNDSLLALPPINYTSGLLCVTRSLMSYPDRPYHWISMISYLLHAITHMYKDYQFNIQFDLIIHCLAVIKQLCAYTPMTRLLTSILVQISNILLRCSKRKIALPPASKLLLAVLSQAAILFPDVQNVLSNLKLLHSIVI